MSRNAAGAEDTKHQGRFIKTTVNTIMINCRQEPPTSMRRMYNLSCVLLTIMPKTSSCQQNNRQEKSCTPAPPIGRSPEGPLRPRCCLSAPLALIVAVRSTFAPRRPNAWSTRRCYSACAGGGRGKDEAWRFSGRPIAAPAPHCPRRCRADRPPIRCAPRAAAPRSGPRREIPGWRLDF